MKLYNQNKQTKNPNWQLLDKKSQAFWRLTLSKYAKPQKNLNLFKFIWLKNTLVICYVVFVSSTSQTAKSSSIKEVTVSAYIKIKGRSQTN